jgi:hypothetical protein
LKRRLVAAAGLALALLVLLAEGAGAQAGGCTATAQGLDVRGFNTPSKALEVQTDEVLRITSTAPSPGSYDVKLEFLGFQWGVANDDYDGNSWADDVAVIDYANHGIGLYKVIAVSEMTSGGSCGVTAYVNVKGGSPLDGLTTTAGIGAATLATVGLVGTMGAAVANARPSTEAGPTANEIKNEAFRDFVDPTHPKAEPQASPEEFARDLERDAMTRSAGGSLIHMTFCGTRYSVVVAIAMTAAAVMARAGETVMATIGRTWR